MKNTIWFGVVALAIFAMSFNALAQPGGGQGRGGQGPGMGGGMGGPGGGMAPGAAQGMGGGMGMPGFGMGAGGFAGIIQNPEFARVLELTPAQVNNLRRVVQETAQNAQEEMQRAREQFAREAAPNPDEMRQRMERIADAAQERIFAELRQEQQTRAREVTFQLSGGLNSPMLNVRTLEVLDLTDAQRERIRGIIDARNEEVRAAGQRLIGGGNIDVRSPEGMARLRAEFEGLNERYTQQITALLTPQQRERVEGLTAAAPALRERLGIPAPGQQMEQRGQQQRGPQQQRPPDFIPGDGSWRPGQGAPPARGGQQRFPRPAGPAADSQ